MAKCYQQMNAAHWLGWPLACVCHAGVADGQGSVKAIKTTRGYREFKDGRSPPKFDEEDSEKATLILNNEPALPILLNRRQGLIMNYRRDHGFRSIAYLEDIHLSRIGPANPFGPRL